MRIHDFLGLGLLLLACNAQAQREVPSSFELQSAYCISALGGLSKDAHTRGSLPAPRAQQEALREAHTAYDRELRRLRSYLVPRMKHLDAEALLAATDRGQSDVDAFLRAQLACKGRCDARPSSAADAATGGAAACINACAAQNPVAERVKACIR